MSTAIQMDILSKLRTAQAEVDAIDRLRAERADLEEYAENTDILRSDYDTSQADTLRSELDQRIHDARITVHEHKWISWIILIAGVIISFGSYAAGGPDAVVGLALWVSIAGFFISRFILKKLTSSTKSKIESRLRQEYQERIDRAKLADKTAKDAYRNAVAADKANRKKETQPKIAEINTQISMHIDNFKCLGILPFNDVDNDPQLLPKMLHFVESGRADSIKECYRLIDEENERKRRREEEERRREEERKRNMPGEVYVYVGYLFPYTKDVWKEVPNKIMIDGQYYGAGGIPYKKIVLQPGWHSISIITQWGDTIRESDTIQFELEGGGKKYFKHYTVNSDHRFVECSSEAALRR